MASLAEPRAPRGTAAVVSRHPAHLAAEAGSSGIPRGTNRPAGNGRSANQKSKPMLADTNAAGSSVPSMVSKPTSPVFHL